MKCPICGKIGFTRQMIADNFESYEKKGCKCDREAYFKEIGRLKNQLDINIKAYDKEAYENMDLKRKIEILEGSK